ncbi:MAG: LPS export ABC transporter permease LptF [Pseudomonadota bacterium]|nr:LPS export ABC transporter permease LptF [Pseudomonadota bacterium]
MSRVNNYIFRQLVWWTIIVATSLTCVVWLTQSLRFVEMIVNRGLSVTSFLSFTLLLLPTFLSLIGPIAIFIAIVFTYNRMLNDREIIVLSASGLSPIKIGRPALILAVLLMGFGYLNTLYLMPSSFRAFKDLQREYRTDLVSVFLQEGVFNPIIEGITVFVRERTKAGELSGIIVHDERKPDKPITIMAEKGAIITGDRGPRVLMINGNRQELSSGDGRLSLLYFEKYTFDLQDINKTNINVWREPRERFLHELFFPKEQAGFTSRKDYRKLRMEGMFRVASPILYFAFTVMALALMLTGHIYRRAQYIRILTAAGGVIILQISVLGLKSLGEKFHQIEAMIYLIPIIFAIFFSVILLTEKRGRQNRHGKTGISIE